MNASDLKLLLTTLALPPAGPIILGLLGLALWRAGRRLGPPLALVALIALWLLSCHAVSVELSQRLLPQHPPATLAQLRQARVQAIVALGGGVLPEAPEYGQPQPSASTFSRLRYAARLARMSNLPLAFSGGVGWAGRGPATEAEAVRLAARADLGTDIRWLEARSRSTAENAEFTAALLRREGVTRIALVTDAWHMPRAVLEFRRAGLDVVAAPTGFALRSNRDLIEWLPTSQGLGASRETLREWLALMASRYL